MHAVFAKCGYVIYVYRWINVHCSLILPFSDLYKLTDEVLGQGAYAKVQECVSLQNGQEFAVKVRNSFFF